MSRRLLLPLVALSGLLTACGEVTIVSDEMASEVEFLEADEALAPETVYLKIDGESRIITQDRIGYSRAGNGKTEFRLIERDFRKVGTIFQVFTEPTYLLNIPESEIEQVTEDYAKTYKRTLEFTDSSDVEVEE